MPVSERIITFPDETRRDTTHDCHRRNVFGHDTPAGNYGSPPDSYPGQNGYPGSYPNVVFDGHGSAFHTVVRVVGHVLKRPYIRLLGNIDTITDAK